MRECLYFCVLAPLTVLAVAALFFILPDVEDAAISASAFVTAFSATIFSDGSSSTDTFVGVVCDNSIGLQ